MLIFFSHLKHLFYENDIDILKGEILKFVLEIVVLYQHSPLHYQNSKIITEIVKFCNFQDRFGISIM